MASVFLALFYRFGKEPGLLALLAWPFPVTQMCVSSRFFVQRIYCVRDSGLVRDDTDMVCVDVPGVSHSHGATLCNLG